MYWRSVVCLSVCLSVCVFGTLVSFAKTAEPIEMPFGADSRWPKEPCIIWGWNTYRRHLANTIEWSNATTMRAVAIMGRPNSSPKLPAPFDDHDPHLINPYLDWPHSPPPTASGSTQPFCYNTFCGQTHRRTDRQTDRHVPSHKPLTLAWQTATRLKIARYKRAIWFKISWRFSNKIKLENV